MELLKVRRCCRPTFRCALFWTNRWHNKRTNYRHLKCSLLYGQLAVLQKTMFNSKAYLHDDEDQRGKQWISLSRNDLCVRRGVSWSFISPYRTNIIIHPPYLYPSPTQHKLISLTVSRIKSEAVFLSVCKPTTTYCCIFHLFTFCGVPQEMISPPHFEAQKHKNTHNHTDTYPFTFAHSEKLHYRAIVCPAAECWGVRVRISAFLTLAIHNIWM